MLEAGRCPDCGQDLDESSSPEADPNYMRLLEQMKHKGQDISQMKDAVWYETHAKTCHACEVLDKARSREENQKPGRKVWIEKLAPDALHDSDSASG